MHRLWNHLLVKLARRNIFRNPKRMIIVLSASFVGFFGICFILGFMNGFFDMMLGTTVDTGLGHLQLRPEGYLETRDPALELTNTSLLRDKIKQSLPSSFSFSARIEREGMLKLDVRMRGVMILGIDPPTEVRVSGFASWITKGSFLRKEEVSLNQPVPILLGEANAKKFELDLGDTIVLTLTDKNSEVKSVLGQVVGFFHSPVEPVDKYTVLMPIQALSQLIYGEAEKNHIQYFVMLSHQKIKDDMLNTLKQKLQKVFPNQEIISFSDLQPGIQSLIEFSQESMGVFYVIILSGFALILLNTILMSVLERKREMGILLALGTRPSFLVKLIVLESFFITSIGAIFGIFVGWLLILLLQHSGVDLSFFAKGMERMAGAGTIVYPRLQVSDLGVSFFLGVIISIVASLYPARQVVKIDPAKTIRNLD
ncbi:MAG: ABC transporter permease [Candidatus Hydrogenedentota bacterium]|nr:MAG: ABC transporter permease [Candidatus Hydrogenedentota bacterium]